MFMAYIGYKAMSDSALAPDRQPITLKGLVKSFGDLWPTIVVMFIVLGGIFGGIVTPTEAAALGATASLFIGLILGKLTWVKFAECLSSALSTTCMVLFIVTFASVFSSFLTTVGTARELAAFIIESGVSKWVFLILVCLAMTFLGCFIDGLSMMIVILPTILPVLKEMGFDLVWFGVIVTVVIELGMLTPPMGINLFVIQGISKCDLTEVLSGTMPFFFIMVFGVILMTVFPGLIMWLPNMMLH